MKVFEGFTSIFRSDDYDDDDFVNEEDYIDDYDDEDYGSDKKDIKAKRNKDKKSTFFGNLRKSAREEKEEVPEKDDYDFRSDASLYDEDDADTDMSFSTGRSGTAPGSTPSSSDYGTSSVRSFDARTQERHTRVENPVERKIVPLRNSSSKGFEVVVIHPKSMEDGNEITDTLLSGRAVVLNLEGINPDVAQRIIDYSAGSCYAMRGNLQKISNYIFLVAPSGVDISGDFQNVLNPGTESLGYSDDFRFN